MSKTMSINFVFESRLDKQRCIHFGFWLKTARTEESATQMYGGLPARPTDCAYGLRLRKLLAFKYWRSVAENQIQVRRAGSTRKLFAVDVAAHWQVIFASHTFWLLPSPGGSGMANYMRLSSTSRPMMLCVALKWRTCLQHNPLAQVFAVRRGGAFDQHAALLPPSVRRSALLQRTI